MFSDSGDSPQNTKFAKYRFDEDWCQSGEASRLYRAQHLETRDTVVFKFLVSEPSQEQIARFEQEVSILIHITSNDSMIEPFVVPVREIIEERFQVPSGDIYSFGYVMPYFAQGSLRKLLDNSQKPPDPREVARLIQSAAKTVAAVHQCGIIHRDLKPENLLLDDAQRVFVADFGIAKRTNEDETLVRTIQGDILGTRGYMAPEQVKSGAPIDARTDVYGLGATLFALCTGRPPYPIEPTGDKNPDQANALKELIEGKSIRPPRSIRNIPRDLEAIIAKCLKHNPEARYADCNQLVEDLGNFLDDRPIAARSIGVPERTWKWVNRNKPFCLVVIALVMTMAALFYVDSLRKEAVDAQKQADSNAAEARKQAKIARTEKAHAEAERLRAETHEAKANQQKALAETERRRAEVRHLQIENELRMRERHPNYLNEAAKIRESPRGQRSWDTEFVGALSSEGPTALSRFIDGDWGILAAVIHPDGKRAVATDAGGRIFVWNVQTSTIIKRLLVGQHSEEHRRDWHFFENRDVDCHPAVCWIGASSQIACGSLKGEGTFRNIETGESVEVLQSDESILSVAGTVDGRHVLFGGGTGTLWLVTPDGEMTSTKHGPSAVTVIHWHEPTHQWIVGFADGRIVCLDRFATTVTAETTVSGIVWDLATDERQAGEHELAVGCDAPEIPLFRLPSLEKSRTVQVHSPVHHAHQAVGFTKDFLLAIDDRGHIHTWNKEIWRQVWSTHAVVVDKRLKKDRADILEKKLTDPKMICLRRMASAVLPIPGSQHDTVLTAGDDAAMTLWTLPPEDSDRRFLSATLGSNPQIAFDPQIPQVLWGLSLGGDLCIASIEQDHIIDSQKAHQGGVADIAVDWSTDSVVTVGGDNRIRFWVTDGKSIKMIAEKKTNSDQSLISVAVSNDGIWLACSDRTGTLTIWNRSNQTPIFHAPISPDDLRMPLTGRIAFNSANTHLAAFGPNQTTIQLRLDSNSSSVTRLNNTLRISGTGGTALCWSPSNEDALFAADDAGRYVAWSNSNEEYSVPEALSPAISIKATRDMRRMAILERNGRILLIDGEFHYAVLKLQSAFLRVSDLAIDPLGRFLAVASEDGKMELWDNKTSTPYSAFQNPIPDYRDRWKTQIVIPPSQETIRISDAAIQCDAKNRLCLLVVCSHSDDFLDEGQLEFVRVEKQKILRESLSVDGSVIDRHCSWQAIGLATHHREEPAIVFRRRTAKRSTYDGELLLGKRRPNGTWHFENVVDSGNMGLFPVIAFDGKQNVSGVFHFNYDHDYLMWSKRGRDEWNAPVRIGKQGDGFHTSVNTPADGTLHLLFASNRFNSNPYQLRFGRWIDENLISEPVHSSVIDAGRLLTTPDGKSAMFVRKVRSAADRRVCLFIRDENSWSECLESKIPSNAGPDQYTLLADGEILLAEWIKYDNSLLLWRQRKNKWSVSKIAGPFSEGSPNYSKVFFDQNGRPLVLVGLIGRPFGWLRVITPKEQ